MTQRYSRAFPRVSVAIAAISGCDNCNCRLQAKDLSASGVRLAFVSGLCDQGPRLNLALDLGDASEPIWARCEPVHADRVDDQHQVGYRFTYLSDADRQRLRDFTGAPGASRAALRNRADIYRFHSESELLGS